MKKAFQSIFQQPQSQQNIFQSQESQEDNSNSGQEEEFNQQVQEEEVKQEEKQQMEQVKYTPQGKATINVNFKGSNSYELSLEIVQEILVLKLYCQQNMFHQWVSNISLDVEMQKQNDLKQLCEGLTLKEFQQGLVDYLNNQQFQLFSLEDDTAVIEFKDLIIQKRMMKTIEIEKKFSFQFIKEDLINQEELQQIGGNTQKIISNLQDRIIQIENNNTLLKESIQYALQGLDLTIEELKYFKQNPFNLQKISKITITKDFNNFIMQNIPKKSRFKQPKLLYRGSKDGFIPQTFHQKCDGKEPIIFIIQTQNYGILGGYCPDKDCFTQSNYKPTQQSSNNYPFIFSYHQGKKIKCNLKEGSTKANAYYANQAYGPVMGGNNDILVQITAKTYNLNIGFSYEPNGIKVNNISNQPYTEIEVLQI